MVRSDSATKLYRKKKKKRMNKTVRKTVLDNGVRIVTGKLPHVRSVSMGVWVNVGARDEKTDENGLSHFIEHMLFKGTTNRSAYDLAKQFDAIGGHTNAFTSMENTCYHASVLDTHFEIMVDILSDIFLNSTFDLGELENERPVILSEISMLEDNPDDYVHILLERNYWGDHPLGKSVLGNRENVMSFDSERIKSFFKERYRPDQILISASGNVDHDRLVERIAPTFGLLTPGGKNRERTKPVLTTHTEIIQKSIEQVHVCLCNQGLSITHPQRFTSSLMNTILGGNMSSRLFQEIREKRGLAYSVYSFSSLNTDSGLTGVYTGVAPDKVTTAVELILNEWHRICDERISAGELSDAMEYTKGNILLSSESTENHMVRIAQNEIHFGRYVPISETIDKINSVTSEAIQDLANSLFKSESPSITALGPVNDDEKIIRLIESFNS